MLTKADLKRVPKELRHLARSCDRYPTAAAFREAVECGDLIRKGDCVRLSGIPCPITVDGKTYLAPFGPRFIGTVICKATAFGDRPAFIVLLTCGEKEGFLKDSTVHVHGIQDLENF